MVEPKMRKSEEKNTLVIAILNEQPIDADEIGKLLRALSTDYHRATGSRLVLSRLELGSTWIFLQDALALAGGMAGHVSAIAGAANNMKTFVGHIKEYLQRPKSTNLTPEIDISPVAETLGKVAEIAARKDAGFKLRYRSDAKKGIQELDAEFTPNQAWEFDQFARADRARAKGRKKAQQVLLPKTEEPLQIEHLAERLRAQAVEAPDQIESLVEVVIEFLKSNGLAHQLPGLALSLEARGLSEMARIVRRHIGPDRITVQLIT